MVAFLARAPEGISTFYAPMRRTLPSDTDSMGYETELNGIQIQHQSRSLALKHYPLSSSEASAPI